MNIGFTQKAQNALNEAIRMASSFGHDCVGSEHLLLGLLSQGDGILQKVLSEKDIDLDNTREMLLSTEPQGSATSLSASDLTPRTKRIIENAARIAVAMGNGYIGCEHLMLALCQEKDSVAAGILDAMGTSVDEVEKDLAEAMGADLSAAEGQPQGPGMSFGANQAGPSAGKKNPDPDLKKSPNLAQYGRNLCRMAREGKIDPIIGRENETNRVIQILSRRTKNNPCLIGEPGVGKTAVVEGLAQRIVEGVVPDTLRDKIIVTLDISAMIAGSKYRGEFEERMKNVMQEVMNDHRIILFIDEIHTIIGAGGAEGAVDAANIIKPALARGEMQVIGATTIDEYRKHIEKDAALERRFQSVMVGEPTSEEAEQILFGLRDKYEAHHKVKITDGALKAAVNLSVRYINDRFLPDKAIDLVDEAASKKRISSFTPSEDVRELEARLKSVKAEKEEAIKSENYEGAARLRDSIKELSDKLAKMRTTERESADKSNLVITEDDIADIVTSWTGIPVKKLQEEEGERLLNLDKILKERVIGQDAAVEAVARAIKRGRMGLKDPKRPIGSFIFLGPTGVGKTELSKVLADVMFGDQNAMIRIDMSEYMEKFSVSRMIGSPPGYVGYDEGGQLTEQVRRKPYSVVLFDEIEKAHPDVFNILLQILEDGVLTDGQGRKVDFKNTIIIMTSNVGAASITEPKKLGFSDSAKAGSEEEKTRTAVMDALKHTFRPEFLNRVDETIVFNKLTDENIRSIARIMLKDVEKRINSLNISIDFSDDVVASLAKEGFDPVYGARPLRRAIVRRIEDSFSEAMLRGEVKEGDSVTAVLHDDGTIGYQKSPDQADGTGSPASGEAGPAAD
ncbi:MAG: ATP-dependent Clp protease ATP-binding subunit [Clostridia bacterium]|nr:ATP-dependent Clp protease ATP-binding subunit [Clostridia bacterium]